MNEPEQPMSVGFFRRQVLYPDCHTWLVFASSLDLLFTWIVLHAGGREANALAEMVIDRFDLPGAITFKFGLMIVVILISEFVGRRRFEIGRRLATIAIAFPATGVLVGVMLLSRMAM